MQLYISPSDLARFVEAVPLGQWQQGRRRILDAVLWRDEELATFEEHRFRRRVLNWVIDKVPAGAIT